VKPLAVLILMVAIATGCGSLRARDREQRALIAFAPSQAVIDGWTVRLEAYAWLNLQPGFRSPGDDQPSPLHVYVFLTPADSLLPAPDVQLETVSLIGADSIWSSFRQWPKLESKRLPEIGRSAAAVAFHVSGGPLWVMRLDSVDVAVRVRRPGRGRSIELLAPRVPLERAY